MQQMDEPARRMRLVLPRVAEVQDEADGQHQHHASGKPVTRLSQASAHARRKPRRNAFASHFCPLLFAPRCRRASTSTAETAPPNCAAGDETTTPSSPDAGAASDV